MLATAVGSLLVCALGPVTIALMPRAGWLVHVLYPGQHLSAAAVASLVTGYFPAGYFLIWLAFPVIGLGIGSVTALAAWGNQAVRERGDGPGGGGSRRSWASARAAAGWPVCRHRLRASNRGGRRVCVDPGVVTSSIGSPPRTRGMDWRWASPFRA